LEDINVAINSIQESQRRQPPLAVTACIHRQQLLKPPAASRIHTTAN